MFKYWLFFILQVVINGKVKVFFLENREVIDGKANTIMEALVECLQEWGIQMELVVGLGSDGAAVMMGVRSGVG